MSNNYTNIKLRLNSPILIGNPHANNIVPGALYQRGLPLGLTEKIMQGHEAYDPHVNNIIEQLDATTISFLLSRLVIDANRVHDRIPRTLGDGTPIPQNENINPAWRIKQYDHYHERKKHYAETLIKKHGFCHFYDIHTFTPIWNGEAREVQIGTFKHKDTPFTQFIEQRLTALCQDFNFIPDAPYDTRPPENGGTMPKCAHRNASEKIADYLGIDTIIGIEISQALANDLKSVKAITKILNQVMQEAIIEFHPEAATKRLQKPATIDESFTFRI